MFEICPDCGSEHISITNEKNEIEYSCINCDWIEFRKNPFHVDAWSVEIHQALAPIDILESLFSNKDIIEFIRPRLKGYSHLNSLKLETGELDLSDEYLRGEIDIAYRVYLRQMIVLATSYIELILKDFFIAWFIAKPLRMNQTLPPENKTQAFISLNEILSNDSKEELINNLAEKAASKKVGKTSIDKILGKLLSDCKIQPDLPIVNDVKLLKEQRNRIVHDEIDEEVTIKQVYSSFSLILYLLYILTKVADYDNVPYVDEIGFIHDFETKLQNYHDEKQ